MPRISSNIGGSDRGSTIAAVRAWAKREETGLARPPVSVSFLIRSAEDSTSTKKRFTCFSRSPW